MPTQSIARPRISRDRAARLIKAYACRAARILASEQAPDDVSDLIDQTRRSLAVRLWTDLSPREFWELSDNIAELRSARAAAWDQRWDSPEEKEAWLTALRGMINAEVDGLAYGFTKAA